jgi:prepilin-type N-terminal cleavage/methylation domain-containing protein
VLMRSMERRYERRRGAEGGFTLVELLVVIAILGILAGIVVFAVGGVTDKGQTAAQKTTCAELQTAEEAYFAQNGSYAGDQATLQSGGFLHTTDPAYTITLGGSTGYTIAGPNCS